MLAEFLSAIARPEIYPLARLYEPAESPALPHRLATHVGAAIVTVVLTATAVNNRWARYHRVPLPWGGGPRGAIEKGYGDGGSAALADQATRLR